MATKIITKTGSGAPTTSDVDRGELAVDLTNKQLYTNDGSSIIKLGGAGDAGQWSLASNGDDIYYDSGNVGIGVENPSHALNVFSGFEEIARFQGESSFNLDLSNPGGTRFDFKVGSAVGEYSFSNSAKELVRIAADGNVGIGTESPAAYGRLSLIQTEDSGVGGLAIVDSTYAQSLKLWCEADKAHIFSGNSGQKDLAINAGGGKVGIGGEPGTRTAADYIDQAKAKIKSWTAAIKTKLDEEPKANKKAVTLEVTDDAFEVIPTEDLVAEWMAERAIGGGNAKLQVAGDVYATGFAPSNSNSTIKGIYGSSVHIDTGGALQIGRTGAGNNWVYMDIHGSTPSFYPNSGFDFNIGRTDRRFKNGYFSGYIAAQGLECPGYVYSSDNAGITFGTNAIYPISSANAVSNGSVDLGATANRFKDAHFSGDVNANRFTSGQYSAPSTTTYFQLNSGSTNVLELRETIFFPYTHDYTTLGRGDKRWKDAYFSGTIYGDVDGAFLRAETIVQDGAPVVDSLQIIRAFMKLRDAVDDPDSSVEELRDKLKVAVVDIIDQFQDLVDSVEPDRER